MSLTKDIAKLMNAVRNQMEDGLSSISSEIDEIIDEKNRNVKRIEKTLDVLLDYAPMNLGKDEFRRLNDYYSTFNKENADFYKKIYDEF